MSQRERSRSLRILLTGSSGVLGRALHGALENAGDIAEPFDLREPDGTTSTVSGSQDVRRLPAVETAVRDVDGVIHLAAISRGAAAETDPARARSVNVEGTRTVLEALRLRGSAPWIIFASSREVYGDAKRLPVSESHPLRPKGVYGQSKLEGEQLVRRWGNTQDRGALILRFTNLYGDPKDYPERVVPAFISAALQNRTLHVRGPDVCIDLLHLDDAVSAVLAAVRCLVAGARGVDVMNIASGRGMRLGDLATRIRSATGSESVVHDEAPVPWTSNGYVGRIARAAERLGWQPRIPIDEGLRSLIAKYVASAGTEGPFKGFPTRNFELLR